MGRRPRTTIDLGSGQEPNGRDTPKNRVMNELSELNDRRARLNEFVTDNPNYDNLGEFQQELLLTQLRIMGAYAEILHMRVKYWDDNIDQ